MEFPVAVYYTYVALTAIFYKLLNALYYFKKFSYKSVITRSQVIFLPHKYRIKELGYIFTLNYYFRL